ncbi:hypothetical protein D9613_011434 [Agrocybe pediades]|uniref:UAA transporter n=1 Tax=Agrocybe pediades TaxID=84607 RepID=A0A8H4QTE5_9AGAR|nr:hypothetical protein D9613_011434 [Agrocybe pediades]
MLSLLSSWATTLSLVFGGCCSNAITLEQLTVEHPNAGSVLTLFQFLVISLYTLPKFVVWTRFGPWLRPRQVPLSRYIIQVALFYFISLLNNAAFAYQIPMAVHIIFRSGGLMISLLLGWLVSKKSYSFTQVISVILVTVGVVITTLSAQAPSKMTSPIDIHTYAKGIGILTAALVLSGFLGLIQDWTYANFGRPILTSNDPSKGPAPWQESMFYLHFLALPMFYPLLPDLVARMHELNVSGPRTEFALPPIPIPSAVNLTSAYPMDLVPPYSLPRLPLHLFRQSANASLVSITQHDEKAILMSFSIPQIYFPLFINTITQLLCVAGVHRLTTRVSALTVTLILVVRKAVSLIISVIGVSRVAASIRDASLLVFGYLGSITGLHLPVGNHRLDAVLDPIIAAFAGTTKAPPPVDETWMWTGAALVLIGTVGYTIGSSRKPLIKVNWERKTK